MTAFNSAPPSEWEETLLAVLRAIGSEPLDWFLTGSAALAVRGLPLTPRDVDLVTSEAGALRLSELLRPWMAEPVQRVDKWYARWFGRAHLPGRVEWVGGVPAAADEPVPGDFGPAAARQLEVVAWRGYGLRVPPLRLMLASALQRGLAERAALIAAASAPAPR